MKSVSERVRVARILFVMGLSVVFAFAGAAVGAGAGTYGVIDLTPPEFHPDDYIRPTGIDGGRQAGYGFSYVATNSQFHAILWSGTASSWVDLNPAGFSSTHINGLGGSQQAGNGSGTATGGVGHAILWYGSGESYVDLNPAGYTYSGANDTNGIQQVGSGKGSATGGRRHALLWSGTAESFVDLHPDGFLTSTAVAISDSQQVGWAWSPEKYDHAMLWTGTAGSCVDLHPTSGLVFMSEAYGVGGGQQVGGGQEVGGSNWHAFLWTGTAESIIDLNPIGLDTCVANATNGIQQVGFGRGEATGSENHAIVWNGSAESYIDLHQYLPSEYLKSEAVAIDDAGNIIGYADTAPDGLLGQVSRHVFVWQIPEPASVSLLLFSGMALLRRARRR